VNCYRAINAWSTRQTRWNAVRSIDRTLMSDADSASASPRPRSGGGRAQMRSRSSAHRTFRQALPRRHHDARQAWRSAPAPPAQRGIAARWASGRGQGSRENAGLVIWHPLHAALRCPGLAAIGPRRPSVGALGFRTTHYPVSTGTRWRGDQRRRRPVAAGLQSLAAVHLMSGPSGRGRLVAALLGRKPQPQAAGLVKAVRRRRPLANARALEDDAVIRTGQAHRRAGIRLTEE
jgi:hypothetical protein